MDDLIKHKLIKELNQLSKSELVEKCLFVVCQLEQSSANFERNNEKLQKAMNLMRYLEVMFQVKKRGKISIKKGEVKWKNITDLRQSKEAKN